jgi:spore coat protein A
MTTRRSFIKIGVATAGAAGAAALTPWGRLVTESASAQTAGRHVHRHAQPMMAAASPLDPASLTRFIDPLPLLPVLAPNGTQHGLPLYEVAMTRFRQQLHAQLPPTTLWGYGGRYPGPTLEARVGQALRVRWTNRLGSRFLLPEAYDPNLDGTNMGEPQVKTVVHLHGANVAADSDGYPEVWFTDGFAIKGPAWTNEVYEYPNRQPPAMLWYHDHAMGQTRLNIYAGLAGLYILRGEDDPALPHGPYEIPLLIQDKMFDTDGSLLYPVRDPATIPTGPNHPGPWIPEFFGNTVLVNGKVWPYLEVEPRRYRFRILNASNARFYNLRLDSGQPMTLIGGDQSFLPHPQALRNILVAPAQRVDIIIDFSGMQGNVVLQNDARTPFPDGDDIDAATAGQVMQFRVSRKLAQPDTSLAAPPAPKLTDAAALARQARVTRNLALIEFDDPAVNDEPIVALLNNLSWGGPTSARVKLGSIEVWNIVNVTDDAHPIHLHLVHFQLLGRQELDAPRYRRDWVGERAPGTGPDPIAPQPYLTGKPEGPGPDETGYLDTVRVPPGQVTSIVVRFGDHTGLYPWHCHILDHEDNAMMQRFEVIP